MSALVKPAKNSRLVARLTAADKQLIERAALLEGTSTTEFAASHLRAAAKKVVRKHEVIRLNKEESIRFVKALLAPPKPPTKRMKAALELYRRTVINRK